MCRDACPEQPFGLGAHRLPRGHLMEISVGTGSVSTLRSPAFGGIPVRTHLFRRTGRALLGLVLGCLAVAVVDPVAQPAWSAPARCGDATPAALAGFLDSAVPARLNQDHVPGAVVSVVDGKGTIFARGYGQADTEQDVAFDASRSLVRIASVTKLFTWTAVMQQVEAGRLDLNADVNTYLTTFQIPATYPEPVTLATLMNHTSGFEDRSIGTGARSAADVPPLGDYLAANMPVRIRPPGDIPAYSNYGAALAGYIVSQISGEPYDQYVQRHLLQPLGMAHSTAAEPVPAALAGDLAHSYDSDQTPPRRIPFTFDPMAPEGAISATAADMANFMVAHLNEGRFGGARILAPATVAQMHQTSFVADPRLGGYAHGFMQRTINGHRVLTHDGSWEGFHSDLILIPDCDLGLFLSANATGGSETIIELTRGFLDRFAPTQPASDTAAPSIPDTRTAPAVPLAGFYLPTRHNESTVEKLTTLLGQSRLTISDDGTVRFTGKDWKPQGNGRYRLADGSNQLVFLTGTDGTRYVATDGPVYQLASPEETLTVNLLILAVFAVPALSALPLPLVAVWRRLRHRPKATSARWRTARWLAAGAVLVSLAFLFALAFVLVAGSADFLYGVPPSFTILLAVPIVALLAAAAALVYTVTGWRRSGAGLAARIHQITLLISLAALTWFLWQWNLIGWQLS